jgi:DNA-binding GntR family transcriptional regulator
MTQLGYLGIAGQLRSEIARGDYPPGTYLPWQKELADRFGVNIGTVRKAIRHLQAEGLVDPISGHGTRVRQRHMIQLPAHRFINSTAKAGPWETACAEQGLEGNTVVTGVSYLEANPRIANALEISVGDPVVRRANQMQIEGQTRQVQDTWLPMWVAEGTPLAAPAKVVSGIYGGLIAAGHRPSKVTEVVSARMPTEAERKDLGLPLGSPVLDTQRTARDAQGRVVVMTHLVVAADHVCLTYVQDLEALGG